MTETTYYRWRSEYGGLKGDQVKRLKELEDAQSPQCTFVTSGPVPTLMVGQRRASVGRGRCASPNLRVDLSPMRSTTGAGWSRGIQKRAEKSPAAPH